MPVPTEILLQILRNTEWKDSFTAYDDGDRGSILDFWNLRRVSRQFRACVEEVFADRFIQSMVLRFYIWVWEVREPGLDAVAGWWEKDIDISFEFARWADVGDRVIFKYLNVRRERERSGCAGRGETLESEEWEMLEWALQEKHKWNQFAGHEIQELCSGAFHLNGDILIQGAECFPDLEWDLQRGECSFDWKTLFTKHFKNRNAMNLWKSDRKHVFDKQLKILDEYNPSEDDQHCQNLKYNDLFTPSSRASKCILQADTPFDLEIELKCPQCPETSEIEELCKQAKLCFAFDAAARRHVCRMQFKEIWKHDRVVVDALTWIDCLGRSPVPLTKHLSWTERERCRNIIWELMWKTRNNPRWHEFCDAIYDRNYRDTLLGLLEGRPFFQVPQKHHKMTAYWNSVGFLPQGSTAPRDFVWPDRIRNRPLISEQRQRKYYTLFWQSIGVLPMKDTCLPRIRKPDCTEPQQIRPKLKKPAARKFKVELIRKGNVIKLSEWGDYWVDETPIDTVWF